MRRLERSALSERVRSEVERALRLQLNSNHKRRDELNKLVRELLRREAEDASLRAKERA